jgi:ParB family chromosome partitioning protein
MGKKRVLGRGLGSLIPGGGANEEDSTGWLLVPVEAIRPNPLQPRGAIDPAGLAELADSIREHGLIQPLVVRREPGGGYTLIAGERRWRAASLAGLEQVPAVVKDASPRAMLEMALIENIQRADLNAIEEAQAYQQLMGEFGLTQEQVAQQVGRSRPAVANTVRLLNLPAEVQAAVVSQRISGAHARALLPLASAEVQVQALGCITEGELSVRQVEAVVRAVGRLPTAEAQGAVLGAMRVRGLGAAQVEAIVAKMIAGEKPRSQVAGRPTAELLDLEERFRRSLGTRVSIQKGPKGGRVIIHFFSDEELQSIYEAIVGESSF